MTFLHHHSNQRKASEQQKSSTRKKEKHAVLYRHRFHIFYKMFLDVLRCCRSVMACCAQMDFYEASRLHLSHFASIKLAQLQYCALHLDAENCFHSMTYIHKTKQLLLHAGDAVKPHRFCYKNEQYRKEKRPENGMEVEKKERQKHVLLTQTHTHLHSK